MLNVYKFSTVISYLTMRQMARINIPTTTAAATATPITRYIFAANHVGSVRIGSEYSVSVIAPFCVSARNLILKYKSNCNSAVKTTKTQHDTNYFKSNIIAGKIAHRNLQTTGLAMQATNFKQSRKKAHTRNKF